MTQPGAQEIVRTTKEQRQRFELAVERVVGKKHEQKGIGTISEKTIHAVLKYYYGPDADMQEVPIGKCVADVFDGNDIFEIQTRNFDRLRTKLDRFLPLYPVTVVYPIPCTKWLCWIDEQTGEVSKRRRSPKKGTPYMAFPELIRIKNYITNSNFHLRLMLMNIEEFRLLNGRGSNRKKGSTRFDRFPVGLVEEVVLDTPRDYLQLLPLELGEKFTSGELGKLAGIDIGLSNTVLTILRELGIAERVGKRGRSFLYRIKDEF